MAPDKIAVTRESGRTADRNRQRASKHKSLTRRFTGLVDVIPCPIYVMDCISEFDRRKHLHKYNSQRLVLDK